MLPLVKLKMNSLIYWRLVKVTKITPLFFSGDVSILLVAVEHMLHASPSLPQTTTEE